MALGTRFTRWAALGGALALSGCPASGVTSTAGGSSGGAATSGRASTGGTSAGSTGRSGSSTGAGGTTGRSTTGTTGRPGGSSSASSGSSGGSTSTGGGSSSSGGGSTSTGGGSSSSGGGSTSTGGAASSGSTGGPGGSVGVLERGGGPLRNAVFQDAAFTQAAVGSATAGLHLDATFNSASWSGPVFSQPLYFVDAATSKSMVIVTTDSNEIYALDPATGAPVWSVPQLVPPIDTGTMTCPGSVSPIGITGTPVIDPVARVMYLNAGTPVAGKPHYQIFALHLDDGSVVSGWPVDIEGLSMSLGNGTTGKFQTRWQNQRGSLTLLNGVVYVPYGGLDGDCGNYSGVVAAVPVANPTAAALWATSAPSGSGIWGPSGVASDGTSIFVSTGNTNNSPYPKAWPNANSEAVIRLSAGTPPLFSGAASDYFAPSDPSQNWYSDDEADADLGSSGVVLFDYPGSAAHPHLAFAIGKTNNAYLVDRDNLGGLSTGLSEITRASNQVFGSMAAYTTATATYVVATASGNGSCSGSTAAFAVSGDPPQLGGGWCSGHGGQGSPIVSSSDGTHDYLVWTTGGSLSALDGDTGATLATVAIPGGGGSYTHWVTPIVAGGALYLAGNNQLMKFNP
ncbi:MAG: PQQ-binding-like beta-propeller repeat protein [Myxococcales bacterium]